MNNDTKIKTLRSIESQDDIRNLISDLRSLWGQSDFSELLRGEEIIRLLGQAREVLQNPGPWQNRVLETLGQKSQSPEMDLKALLELLDTRGWKTKLSRELKSPRALEDRLEGGARFASLAYRPLGVVLHICPGNSFLGGVDSALHGLVAGNFNLVKISKQTPPVLAILGELLQELGLPKGYLTVAYWKGGNFEVENYLKTAVDGIAVWGGEEVVRSYKNQLPPGVRLMEFGPKLSFSVATQKGWTKDNLGGLVQDVCRYEQMSCTSSQILFVEKAVPSQQALSDLGEAFALYSRQNPTPPRSENEQMEVFKELERAKLHKTQGQGDYLSGYPDWLVVLKEKTEELQPSPLYRTLFVYTYETLQDLKSLIQPIRHYLQTASLACDLGEVTRLSETLWQSGVTRVVRAGRSTQATDGAPHDGQFLLAQFLKAVSLEDPLDSKNPDHLGDEDLHWKKLEKFVRSIKDVPIYRERLWQSDILNKKALTKEEFEKIPWLRKEDFHKLGPPAGVGLTNKPYSELEEAFVFTTGGSTGEPKYTLYSKEEWDEVTDIFARQFEALGLSPKDRVANLFVGGGLWSAFLAVSGGIEKVGAINLPLGGDTPPDLALEIFKRFQVTTIFGLPSTILKLAHHAQANPHSQVKIPKILYGGEAMSESMRDYVQKVFEADTIKSGAYAAVDAGMVAYQCDHAKGGIHHVLERYCYVEVCNEETGKQVPPGEVGEIIVTNFSKKMLPILRLRTGDRGRQILENCGCGSRAMTFELMGRSDDMVRAGGANIFVSDLDKLCKRHPEVLSFIYQIHVSKVGVDDKVEIWLETQTALSPTEKSKYQKEIQNTYLEIATELRSYIDEGYLPHFGLRLLDPGEIRPNEKTRKIRRVVDTR